MTLACLPGKIAGLVELDDKGDALIVLPDAAKARAMHLGIGSQPVLKNVCVSSGARSVKEGQEFYALPKEGLWIGHMDEDIPEVGQMVPKGFQLRIYREDAVWAVDN